MANHKQSTTNSPEFITRKELSARLGISEATSWRLDKAGVITSVRVGGSVRYSWPDVVASLPKSKGGRDANY